MQLEVWIGFDEFSGKTDAECVEIMCAEMVTKDHSLWNYQRVFDTYGSSIAEGFFQRFKVDGKEAAALQYKDPGIDFSNEEFQTSLDQWATDPLVGVTAQAIRVLAVQRVSKWRSFGFPAAPTEAEVSAARLTRTDRAETNRFADEVWNLMLRSGSTKAELKAAVAGW
jgi:hypothetical protein